MTEDEKLASIGIFTKMNIDLTPEQKRAYLVVNRISPMGFNKKKFNGIHDNNDSAFWFNAGQNYKTLPSIKARRK